MDAMLAEMPVHAFHEWMAFYQLEPWDDVQNWARHGDLMALLANLASSKDAKPARREDFIPQE